MYFGDIICAITKLQTRQLGKTVSGKPNDTSRSGQLFYNHGILSLWFVLIIKCRQRVPFSWECYEKNLKISHLRPLQTWKKYNSSRQMNVLLHNRLVWLAHLFILNPRSHAKHMFSSLTLYDKSVVIQIKLGWVEWLTAAFKSRDLCWRARTTHLNISQ